MDQQPSSCLHQWTRAHQHHYTVLTNDVLVPAVHLFGYTENTIIIWRYCGEFLFLCLRLCQPDVIFCHVLGINVGSFCPRGLRSRASCLQGTVGLEPCTLLLYSFVHLSIPPPGFWFPLVVVGETTNFGGSIQQGALQLWPSWLDTICSISICARSGGNCSLSSHRFYLEGQLEQASSSWVPELPGSGAGW